MSHQVMSHQEKMGVLKMLKDGLFTFFKKEGVTLTEDQIFDPPWGENMEGMSLWNEACVMVYKENQNILSIHFRCDLPAYMAGKLVQEVAGLRVEFNVDEPVWRHNGEMIFGVEAEEAYEAELPEYSKWVNEGLKKMNNRLAC